MADPLPIAGASVGDTLRFGNHQVENIRWSVAPPGWDSCVFGKNLAVFDPNQNGAAVWFAFEQIYTLPSAFNVPFNYSNDTLIPIVYGWDSCKFGSPFVTRTPSFETIGDDYLRFGTARVYDAATPNTDFNFVDTYTKPPSLNIAFIFEGAVMVTGATLGDLLRIGSPNVVNTALQFWPNGFDTLEVGKPRVSDQFDKNFIFTETYTTQVAKSLRFDFSSVASEDLPITGGGWDSCQWGVATKVALVDIAVNFTGPDFLKFGFTRVYDPNINPENRFGVDFRFIEQVKYPSSSLNIPFYFSWINRLYPQSWDSCQFGNSWVSNWTRFVYAQGTDFLSFGSPERVWNFHQWMYPSGSNFLLFGSPERVWNYHQWVYPVGSNFLQVGTPVKVWNFTQWVYQNGSYYTQFGLPNVENTAVPIYPIGNSFVEFGVADVQNTAQIVEPVGFDSFVCGESRVDHVPDYYVTTNILLLPPLMKANVSYDPSVDRPTVCMRSMYHQITNGVVTGAEDGFESPVNISAKVVAWHQNAVGVNSGVEHKLPDILKPQRMFNVSYWQDADGVCNGFYAGQQEGVRVGRFIDLRHQDAESFNNGYLHRTPGLLAYSRQYIKCVQQQALSYILGRVFHHNNGVDFENGWQVWWQEAVVPQPGISFYPPEPPAPPKCYTPNPHLLFKGLQVDVDTNLVFTCEYVPPEDPNTILGQVIPYRKVYVVMNSVKLFKKDGMVELPVLSFGIDIDMDSWCWGFTCSVHYSCLNHVASVVYNEPVELIARVNGEDFEVLAESISRNRSWESKSLSIQGRGKSAYLSDPYAPKLNFANTEIKTAQQLMIDALTYNGVSIGWGVDWGVEDWSVPSGVWSVAGTYMDALLSVANACGAFILPHASQNILYVKPRYSAWPWAWPSVPNNQLIQIPSAVVETESIKWETKPNYNGVYVSGVNAGTLALVKKLGTAGDYLDTMVTDSLITSAAAARQRGGTILSQTGRMATISISLPVLPETGIIRPGRLIKYVDSGQTILGMSKSVSVSLQGGPSLRQSIELEVHYG